MTYDFDKKYSDKATFLSYIASNKIVANKFGNIVKAIELSNREYQHRYDKLSTLHNMKKPPLSDRIFSGYLVVRNLNQNNEYETWIPYEGFKESYRPLEEKQDINQPIYTNVIY